MPPPTNMKKMLAGISTPAILDLRSHAPWNYQAEGTHMEKNSRRLTPALRWCRPLSAFSTFSQACTLHSSKRRALAARITHAAQRERARSIAPAHQNGGNWAISASTGKTPAPTAAIMQPGNAIRLRTDLPTTYMEGIPTSSCEEKKTLFAVLCPSPPEQVVRRGGSARWAAGTRVRSPRWHRWCCVLSRVTCRRSVGFRA